MLTDGQLKWARIDETFDVAYNATTEERIEITGKFSSSFFEHLVPLKDYSQWICS